MIRNWRQGRPGKANAVLLVNPPVRLCVMDYVIHGLCGVYVRVSLDLFSDWLTPFFVCTITHISTASDRC